MLFGYKNVETFSLMIILTSWIQVFIADDNSKSLEELLEMIVMGRIPDQTSIPALIDVQKTKGSWSLRKNFPFSMNSRKIHKILFVLSADEPIPQGLIQCVKHF
jgi:hypothetical protein